MGKEKTGDGNADVKVGEEHRRRERVEGEEGGGGGGALVPAGAVFICRPEALTHDPCRPQ